jgi:hypothetical protein
VPHVIEDLQQLAVEQGVDALEHSRSLLAVRRPILPARSPTREGSPLPTPSR